MTLDVFAVTAFRQQYLSAVERVDFQAKEKVKIQDNIQRLYH